MTETSRTGTLYRNGRILTMEDGDPVHEALGVRDGRVVAAGSEADVRRTVGAGAEEIDLRGASVMPGIVDTHPHVIHFGVIEGAAVDIKDATSHDDIVGRIAARAATVPKGEWIMTTPVGEPHYFLRRSWRDLAEGRLPDRHVLDRAAPDHPVWIQAWAPVIPNVIAFNSAGLAKLGIGRETPDQVSTSGSRRTRPESRRASCAARSRTTIRATPSWTRCWCSCRSCSPTSSCRAWRRRRRCSRRWASRPATRDTSWTGR